MLLHWIEPVTPPEIWLHADKWQELVALVTDARPGRALRRDGA